MFANAIEKVARFTRPLHTIMRTYQSKQVIPGSATLFFVNKEGYAVTCKHVIEMLAQAERINLNYRQFTEEKNQLQLSGAKDDEQVTQLAARFHIHEATVIQMLNTFVDCVDYMSGFTWHLHPTLDLAILKFNDFNKVHYQECATFIKDAHQIRQGNFLCRLGFPFPEFSNFIYHEDRDDIEWTNARPVSPRFPIEGMVTRFLADPNGLYGIELSTPGLRGQSGGPLFNSDGLVCGMQFSTKHLHLGFDMVNTDIMINNVVQKVSDYSFLHLGQCIHADAIKTFLRQHGVKYYEE
ncbi:MAG TPA: serine protease [Ferruginibacter sp.]|nr:trypsin-like peptidase domain-containing protein [Ferruginibacter sp.]HRN80209.1 serine protease [Ferruginibacter sp.]HRO18092.1 serine protease [Ferruginibacter sp.]HRQ21143.1 serine protease [Ferruginibacter sp.]